MQPKPFPESQNHGDWRESKSRRPFFRSLLENAVPKGRLTPDGALPSGNLFQGVGPLWQLTEGGWTVVNRTHGWALFAILISVLSFTVSVGSLLLTLYWRHQ